MSKAKKTKQYIIDKTSTLFNKQGFKGTSLSDMTKATDLTKGSIYGNFSNKEEVATAVFNHNYQNLIKKFAVNLNLAHTSIEKLEAFLDTYDAIYEDIIELGGCPILNNAVDADDTNENLKILSIKAFVDWNIKIISIIEEGKNTKEIYSAVDAEYYADLFVSLIEGGLLLSKTTGEKRYFVHAISHLRTIIKDTF